ncbi:cytidine deaminase [Bacteroidia bacterium]|nr:cytidine deaminase [Bacteroidia bacterium]
MIKYRIKLTVMTITISIEQHHSLADCVPADAALIRHAMDASNNAYVPYSHFKVGAAALLANGEVITGCNQENAAYPSGLCAERVALFAAGARFPDVAVKALAIVAQDETRFTPQPAYPCGACRQVMLEVERRGGSPLKVIMAGAEKIEIVQRSKDLLPLQFDF